MASWLYTGGSVTGELRISSAGPSRVYPNPSFAGDVIEFPEATEASSIELEISARNAGPRDALVIDQLIWGTVKGRAAPRPILLSYAGLGLLAGLLTVPLVQVRRRWLLAMAVGLLIAVTAYTRFETLYARASGPLDPDAVVYRIYADRFQWWPPWENGIFSANFSEREPLFPLVVHAYFDALGSSDFHIRVVSSTLSVFAVPLTLVAAKRRLSWPVALTVAAIVALNTHLVNESVRGLRTELELCEVLGLYIVLDRPPSPRPRRESIVAGVLGAALVLTRTFYLPMILMATGISFVSRYRPLRTAFVSLLISVALVAFAVVGHRVAMFERQGDAFWDTAGYARWNANVEKFQYGHHLDHPELFPSEADYLKIGPYSGPRITYTQYLFQIHTLPDFVIGTAAGFIDVLATTGGFYVPGADKVLEPISQKMNVPLAKVADDGIDLVLKAAAAIGLLALVVSSLRRPQLADLLLPTMVASGLAFSTFLYHLRLVEPYRNTIQFYPLALIAGGWLTEETIRRLRGLDWRARGRYHGSGRASRRRGKRP